MRQFPSIIVDGLASALQRERLVLMQQTGQGVAGLFRQRLTSGSRPAQLRSIDPNKAQPALAGDQQGVTVYRQRRLDEGLDASGPALGGLGERGLRSQQPAYGQQQPGFGQAPR